MDYETAKHLFDYDFKKGRLIHKNPYHRTQKGQIVGTPQPNGYRQFMYKRKRYYVHRLVWLWHHGYMPQRPMIIDHINRDKKDNRIENLREVSSMQNSHNTDYSQTWSETGYRGVCYLKDRGKYMAYCTHEGKRVFIGNFDDPHSAAEAYNRKILELRGEMVDVNTIRTSLPEEFRKLRVFDGQVVPDWMK